MMTQEYIACGTVVVVQMEAVSALTKIQMGMHLSTQMHSMQRNVHLQCLFKSFDFLMKAWSSEKISVVALVLLITGAIDSIRNLPATALFGSSLVFYFIFSAIVFLIPVALVSAELSSTWSEEEGGIYS